MSSIKKKKGPLRLISKEASILADGQSAPCSPAVKKTYRLVVVGSARTGKSAILSRFLEKGFEDRYIPTIENFYRKLYKIKGDLYQLDIIDCSGNDPFPAARKLSYISGDMFLIVSSVEQAESIYHMLEIRQQIEDCKASRGVTSTTPEVPCVFVLNKTDLPEYRWMVTQEEIQRKVEEEAGTSENLILCSALKDTNIDKAFGRLFTLNKCPKQMNPEIGKRLRNELSEDNQTNSKRHILQRMRNKFSRESDDVPISYTDETARRPSLRTDLLINRAKTSVVHQHLTQSLSNGTTPNNNNNNNNNNNSEKSNANGRASLVAQNSLGAAEQPPIAPDRSPKPSRCHLM